MYPIEYGGLTQLYAGTAPEAAEFNGKYLAPWARIGSPTASTQEEEAGRKLWEWLDAQVKDM